MKILICFSFAINSRAVFGEKVQIPPDFTFKSGGFRQKKSNSAQFRFFHYQYSFSVSGVLDGSPTEQITALIKAIGKKDNGHLSEYLQNLIKCDFIRYYFVKTKKIRKTNGLYQLTDFFTIFHNTFLTRPNNDEHYWSHNLQTPLMNTWLGLAFERVCMAHIPQIKRCLGIDRIGTEYYSWRSKTSENGSQIDLLIERADRIINLCEIKYSTTPYSIDKSEEMKLRIRQSDFAEETGTKYAIFPTMITTYGIRKNAYSGYIQEEVTLDDLFLF